MRLTKQKSQDQTPRLTQGLSYLCGLHYKVNGGKPESSKQELSSTDPWDMSCSWGITSSQSGGDSEGQGHDNGRTDFSIPLADTPVQLSSTEVLEGGNVGSQCGSPFSGFLSGFNQQVHIERMTRTTGLNADI